MMKTWTGRLTVFRDRTGWVGRTIAVALIGGMGFLSVVYFLIVGIWLYHHL